MRAKNKGKYRLPKAKLRDVAQLAKKLVLEQACDAGLADVHDLRVRTLAVTSREELVASAVPYNAARPGMDGEVQPHTDLHFAMAESDKLWFQRHELGLGLDAEVMHDMGDGVYAAPYVYAAGGTALMHVIRLQ